MNLDEILVSEERKITYCPANAVQGRILLKGDNVSLIQNLS